MASCLTSTLGSHRAHGARRIGFLLFGSAVLAVTFATSAYGEAPRWSALPDVFRAEQLLWEIELGSHHYTVPRIDGERIYIGVNDTRLDHPVLRDTGGGILMCLERATGKMIWQRFHGPSNASRCPADSGK